MNWVLTIPLQLRAAVLFLLGAFIGGQLNRGVYRLAWRPRPIGPWSRPHEKAPPRRWFDRIPIVGWATLAREAPLHGSGFWIRPLLIELFVGLGFAALYWWEMQAGLMPALAKPHLDLTNVQFAGLLHAQYLSHILLISLMVVAAVIDLDEKTIPDAVTVPGTLAALILMVWQPAAHPPIIAAGMFPPRVAVLSVVSPMTSPFWREDAISGPSSWPPWLDGRWSLLFGLGFFLGWWFAILPKTWTTRRGFSKALQYLAVSIVRHPGWWKPLLLAMIGSLAIAAMWCIGGWRWQSLLTSLTGMAFGGGLVWAIRIIAGGVLAKEAMGFGDVTLMAMVGAFLGWQSALMVFFLAPFAALFGALAQWLVTRHRDIAFGPYLCLAALLVILQWTRLWESFGKPLFALVWLIPAVVGTGLILMACSLFLWRVLETYFTRGGDGDGREGDEAGEREGDGRFGPAGVEGSPDR